MDKRKSGMGHLAFLTVLWPRLGEMLGRSHE